MNQNKASENNEDVYNCPRQFQSIELDQDEQLTEGFPTSQIFPKNYFSPQVLLTAHFDKDAKLAKNARTVRIRKCSLDITFKLQML